MKKKSLLIILTLAAGLTNLYAQQIIAHRGYWKMDGSAQNSVEALMKADALKAYGSEVDIWLSSDGIPVVNHDAEVIFNGKKLTIQDTPLKTLRQVKLTNDEVLPTVEEYLDAFMKCSNTKLIIEFKTHNSKDREDLLAQKVVEMVRGRGLQDRVEYISFGINFVQQLIKLDPQAIVYYLNGDMTPQIISKMGLSGIDYHYSVLLRRPEWIKEAHSLGLKVNTWTVNNPEDIQKVIDLKVDFITTDEPLIVREIIQKQ